MKLHRVRRFPSLEEGREPQAIYLERAPGQKHFTFYVTFSDPAFYTSSISESYIGEKIATAVAGTNSVFFAQDIMERDALALGGLLTSNAFVSVADASGDVRFIGEGGMLYAFNALSGVFSPVMKIKDDPYAKTKWTDLDGLPESPIEDIDDAVEKRHEHENKETIDGLSFLELENGYKALTFNEAPVGNSVVIEPVW